MRDLELQDVRVDVGHGRHRMTAVDRVTLAVPAGRIVGLVGESGSGKSTLARAAAGIIGVTSGKVLLDGVDVTRTRDRRRIQMVFQNPNGSLDPRMKVGDSMAEAIGGRRRAARAEVPRWLEMVGLPPTCAEVLPRALSGGQRQRIALARALAAEPDVIIADEITSALDVSVQGSVLNLVRDLQRELGVGLLFISHNLAVVRYVSDEVAVMNAGRIVEHGATTEVVASPKNAHTRELLAATPRLGGSLYESDQENHMEDLQAKLDAAIENWEVPGAAVGVLHEGREWYACAGVTSLENPLAVDADTLFQLGSTGKTFTATAVLRLVEDGRVDLDAPVRRYLPELRLADEAVAANVTVLHLLNHTAGWAGDRMDDTGEGDDALRRYVELMREFKQLTPLGSSVSYNNAAFALAGRLVEQVTGMVYEQAIKQLVLEPLGLASSYFFPNEIMTRRFATGHRPGPDGSITVAQPWKLPRSANAGGGIAASVRDVLAWARFHLGDGRAADGTRLLSHERLVQMQQPTADMRGSAMGDDVGIAWLLRDVDGVRVVSHGGRTIGQDAELVMVPDRGFAVAVITNCAPNGAQLIEELRRWALHAGVGLDDRDPEPIAVDAATIAKYAGRYETPDTICDVSVEDASLVLRMNLKPETLARLQDAGETPPPAPPPAELGLLPGTAHRYVATSGPAAGMKGYFASDPSGAIVGLHAGGRMAVRVGADEGVGSGG